MRRLTALSGPVWPIGPRLRDRLRRTRAYLPIDVLEPGSAAARARFGTPPPAAADGGLVVVSDDRRVWLGDRAWLMLLWALVPTRAWANRLAALRRGADARRLLDAWGHAYRPRVRTLLDPARPRPAPVAPAATAAPAAAGGPPAVPWAGALPHSPRLRSTRRVRETHGWCSILAVVVLGVVLSFAAEIHPGAAVWVGAPGVLGLLAGPRELRTATLWTAFFALPALVAGPIGWGVLYLAVPLVLILTLRPRGDGA